MPENIFKVGTAEIKNWLPVIAAMNAEGRRYHQVDYVPCYRSEAGTGNAMAFVYWDRSIGINVDDLIIRRAQIRLGFVRGFRRAG